MSADSLVSPTAENGNAGNKRTPCPLHGCKRVYTDGNSLQNHIKDHEISAESLPGKILLCSTVGCSGSFPNMQKLMEHMRHHHKPNIYFLCESCRTKLRSYRGLLTHLHTCSKVPRGKTKPAEPTPPPPPAAVTPMDSVSTPQAQTPNPGGSPPQLDPAAPPLLGSRFLSNTETSPQRLAEAAPPSQLRNGAAEPPPSLNLVGPAAAAAPDPPEAPSQHQTQTRSPGSAPHSPPASAVWKKSQGVACSRRILWEHTKGRYTCVQCGHSATNRKEMTQHINTQHATNKPAEDTGSSASST